MGTDDLIDPGHQGRDRELLRRPRYRRTDGPAVPESREPASVVTEATGQPLSPAAQAVLDAVTAELDWDARYHSHSAAAAALRAVADQAGSAKHWHVDHLRTIAAELEGSDG